MRTRTLIGLVALTVLATISGCSTPAGQTEATGDALAKQTATGGEQSLISQPDGNLTVTSAGLGGEDSVVLTEREVTARSGDGKTASGGWIETDRASFNVAHTEGIPVGVTFEKGALTSLSGKDITFGDLEYVEYGDDGNPRAELRIGTYGSNASSVLAAAEATRVARLQTITALNGLQSQQAIALIEASSVFSNNQKEQMLGVLQTVETVTPGILEQLITLGLGL